MEILGKLLSIIGGKTKLFVFREKMASNVEETKKLKELDKREAIVLLENIQCKTITNTLLSGEYGEITGEVLEELDDKILQSIGINISFQRKQFLKSITKYKSEGIPIDLLRSDKTLKKQSLETDQTTVDDNHTLSMVESRTKLLDQSEKILEACSGEMDIYASPAKKINIKETQSIDDKAKLHALIQNSEKVSKECTSEMDIYAFPAKKVKVKDLQQPLYGTNLKKIIIMGETGTGKSTFINAFINYAVGVEMEDPFRFKLVHTDARANNQTISQTSEISGYLIGDTLLDFSIQIWDTPGFGDTRGIERDEEIKQQINELLKIEDFCHAVCFVVKASVNRLTETQKYIIDRVLLFFGKEAQENIYVLVTFADDSRPDVLHALEKYNNFPFAEDRWFAFNNGNLFRPASQRTSFSKVYWEMTNDNLDKLFNKIGEICPFSLTSTKEVVAHREDISQNLNAIAIEVGSTARKKEKWEENLLFLKSQKKAIKSDGVFRENKPMTRMVKVPTFGKNTVCNKCETNCHIGCRKIGKIFCDRFDWWFNCKICKCKFKKHDKVRWKYEKVDNTCQVVHEPGKGNQSTQAQYEQALYETEQQRDEMSSKLSILIENAREEIQRINNSVMLEHATTLAAYFKSLIKREEELHNYEEADIFRDLLLQEELKIASLEEINDCKI